MNTRQTTARVRGPAPPRQVMTLRIPTEIHTQFRLLSVLDDTTTNDLVLKLMVDYLDSEGRQRLKEALDALDPYPLEQEAARAEEEAR